MREYEVMLILPAEADESVIATAADRIAKTVADSGGEVANIDRWGRRRFAYEIDHQHEGYYVVVRFRAEPTVQKDLERVLVLADEVIRFKVMVRPQKEQGRYDKADKAAKARQDERAAAAADAPAAPAQEPEVEPPAAEGSDSEPEEKEASPTPA